MRRLLLWLAVLSNSGGAYAQDALLTVRWDTPAPAFRALADFRENGSDPGAVRGYRSSACRSTMTAEDDFPLVVRFDSTETTRMGSGAPIVNAVAMFPGSAWDVTVPGAPRRLNMLLNERASSAPDTTWTPGLPVESIYVMASSYDGSGTTYAGQNIALQLMDCAYAIRLERNPAGEVPARLLVRPAAVGLFAAGPTPTPAGSGIRLWWSYDGDEPQQVYRAPTDQPWAEVPIATIPAGTRSYVDASLPPDVLSVYRVVAGGAGSEPAPSSVRVTPMRGNGATGSHRMSLRGVARSPLSWHVTGYAAPDGREYALLGEEELVIYDVTDPDPVEVGRLPGTGGYRAAVSGRYAYLLGPEYSDVPVRVVDLATPSAPVVVREFWPHPNHPGHGARAVTIADGRLYLSGEDFGTTIWSLTSPSEPSYLGAYQATGFQTNELDLLVRGDRLYVAWHRDGVVDILDVSTPTQPTRIAGFSGTTPWSMCADESGDYLFISEVKGSYVRTAVFDVSDPHNVVLVAQLPVQNRYARDCGQRGDLLFTSEFNGVHVWNVADPTAPVEVAFYNGAEMTSVWGVWPHLPSGRLLAHDLTGSLFVLELDPVVAADPVPTSAFSFALAPNPTAGSTTALVTLVAPAEVTLTVHDVLGRSVSALAPSTLNAGAHRVALPVAGLPAGIYVVRMTAGDRSVGTQTLTIIR